MPRFFVESVSPPNIYISGSDVNHILNVLRLEVGDEIEVFDSQAKVYKAEIQETKKDQVVARIIKEIKENTELKVDITLAQCLPKGKKMDLIIQKATELGVNHILPVISERSIPKIEEKEDRKLEHWGMIAKEAAEQSGRSRIPEISHLLHFTELLKEAKIYKLALIPWEGEKKNRITGSLANGLTGKLLIIIGPEGGFSSEEVKQAKKAGIKPVSLGKRILRSETAAIFSLAVAVSALER